MKLFLMRHGSAVSIGEQGVATDDGRMLTREGRESTATILRRLRKVCQPQRIWSSPLVRAWETAEIAQACLSPPAALASQDDLSPGMDVKRVVQWLKTCREDSLMLVGHMPDLAILAGFLTLGIESEGMALKKSAVCCLEFDGKAGKAAGQLMWLVTASLLSRLEPSKDG